MFCDFIVLPQAASSRAVFGKLTDAPGQVGIRGGRVKGPQRRAVHHQRDGDVAGTADAVEMVLDVAEHEADLVEIAQMIDDLQFALRLGIGCCAGV
jgi:hypothetical protein